MFSATKVSNTINVSSKSKKLTFYFDLNDANGRRERAEKCAAKSCQIRVRDIVQPESHIISRNDIKSALIANRLVEPNRELFDDHNLPLIAVKEPLTFQKN